jgi:hypothetical protein
MQQDIHKTSLMKWKSIEQASTNEVKTRLGKYEHLLTHTSKKPQDLKEVEKLTKLKDLCHESLSVQDHRHGNNNFEKNYHSWIGVNHGIVHYAEQLTSIKGGMWTFQVAKM